MSEHDVRCKGVHVKLDKETHTGFKTRLVQHGVTMQDAFEEFARRVAEGNVSANRLIEKMIRERVRAELAAVGLKPLKHDRRPKYLGELDHDGLYDLINEGEEKDNDEVV